MLREAKTRYTSSSWVANLRKKFLLPLGSPGSTICLQDFLTKNILLTEKLAYIKLKCGMCSTPEGEGSKGGEAKNVSNVIPHPTSNYCVYFLLIRISLVTSDISSEEKKYDCVHLIQNSHRL